MWKRRTFHECAIELLGISEDFRAAHTNKKGFSPSKREQVMQVTSTRGVEILRILALSIRSDQDYGLTGTGDSNVGVICQRASTSDARLMISTYRPPYSELHGFTSLRLRQALNKVAHADPTCSGFFADDNNHDLILTGRDQGNTWVVIISLLNLCNVIKMLPDAITTENI